MITALELIRVVVGAVAREVGQLLEARGGGDQLLDLVSVRETTDGAWQVLDVRPIDTLRVGRGGVGGR